MESSIRVLLIIQHYSELEFYQQLLIQNFTQDYELAAVNTFNEAYKSLNSFSPQVVIIDHANLNAENGEAFKQFELFNSDQNMVYIGLLETPTTAKNDNYYLLKTEITADKLQHTIMRALAQQSSDSPSIHYFSEKLTPRETQFINAIHFLEHALDNNELHLLYQPLLQISTGKIHAIEASLNWNYQPMAAQGYQKIASLIESCGLSVTLGTRIFQYYAQEKKALNPLPVVFSVSARQLEEENFCESMMKTVGDLNQVILKIPESILLEPIPFYQDILCECAEVGMKICVSAIDNKRNNFHYFSEYPLHYVEVAVNDILPNKTLRINELGRRLKNYATSHSMQIIANGVEVDAQLRVLYELGCHYAQGNLIAKPMTSRLLQQYLTGNLSSVKINKA
ncbi:MAG: EAL domain-containing protein [Legionellales bacterium]|nr:EAL domain-containing protein [Legionellales bacterium]